jgi:hypothetical protein
VIYLEEIIRELSADDESGLEDVVEGILSSTDPYGHATNNTHSNESKSSMLMRL